MKRRKLSVINWIEIVVGVIPPTAFYLITFPFLLGLLFVSLISLYALAADGKLYLIQPTLLSMRDSIISLVGGGAGLFSLWFVILKGTQAITENPRVRFKVGVGLLIGISVASYWLTVVIRGGDAARDWIWYAALCGPILIGIRYLLSLFIRPR